MVRGLYRSASVASGCGARASRTAWAARSTACFWAGASWGGQWRGSVGVAGEVVDGFFEGGDGSRGRRDLPKTCKISFQERGMGGSVMESVGELCCGDA